MRATLEKRPRPLTWHFIIQYIRANLICVCRHRFQWRVLARGGNEV